MLQRNIVLSGAGEKGAAPLGAAVPVQSK